MPIHENSEQLLRIATEFEQLLASPCDEETIHQFIYDHPIILGVENRVRTGYKFVEAAISKFPVSPDRIPDFAVANIPLEPMQCHNRISFIELKKADEQLFVQHGRMSRALNDAWIECADTKRIFAKSYRDFLRRLLKQVDGAQLEPLEHMFQLADLDPRDPRKPNAADSWNDWMPIDSHFVFIGRRSTLSAEDLDRVRELSRNSSVEVFTYDFIIDQLREAADRRFLLWPWHRA